MKTRVFTYECVDKDAPANLFFTSLIAYPSLDPNAKAGALDVHPIRFFGFDADDARDKATTWWDDELKKARLNSRGGRGRPQTTSVTDERLQAEDEL